MADPRILLLTIVVLLMIRDLLMGVGDKVKET